MINCIYNVIYKRIEELTYDANIVSIFIVGSMSSNDYAIRKNNDCDLRFIIKDYNAEIISKINKVLELIKKDLIDMNYGCDVSNIIGPVKMESKCEENILLHAITMNEKDLNSLPNIHKYSYSCNYKHLFGRDLLKQYKNIILSSSDVIDSVEGIEYCIDSIKRKKIGFNELVDSDGSFFLKHKEVDATNSDLIEIYTYSYNKSKNNILNLIKTNNLSCNLEDLLDYSIEEKKLIDIIEKKELDFNNVDVYKNTIILILLKLEKTCLQLSKKKKYYNSLEWGIINSESREMRNRGFEFLREINLPTGNYFSIKFEKLFNSIETIMKNIGNSNYLVLFEPPNNKQKRFGIDDVNSVDTIDEFIKNNPNDFSQYVVSFIEKIEKVDDSFAGTVLSNGDGNTIIEIVADTCDSRELTSIGTDANRINNYRFISFDDNLVGLPSNIKYIKDVCQFFKGYYEFSYGKIKGIKDIYFTFYSDNKEYINFFEGGRKYEKTLRNRRGN